jgi:membrane carboxypeptidase/penicillin-binding protein
LLAALPKAPSRYNPYKNNELAKFRRNLVINNLFENNYINKKKQEETVIFSAEARASFLSRALSWVWDNRAYGVVGYLLYYLWKRDGVRMAMWKAQRRAQNMRQQAMAKGIDVVAAELADGLAQGLDGLDLKQLTSTAKGYATKTMGEGRGYVSYVLRQRPRSVVAWLVIVAFQTSKAITYYRARKVKDPVDRMNQYPSSVEEKVNQLLHVWGTVKDVDVRHQLPRFLHHLHHLHLLLLQSGSLGMYPHLRWSPSSIRVSAGIDQRCYGST